MTTDGAGLGREFFELAKEQAIPVVRSQKMRLDSMTNRANHQGVVASLGERSFASWQEVLEAVAISDRKMLVLALDGVQDPGNFGALLRTAEGAGAQGVVVASAGSCPLSATVSKASAGADAYLKVARSDRLDRVLGGLADEKIQVVATVPDGELNYWEVDWKRPSVLVLGAEGSGISESVLRRCTHKVRLPMLGKVESLNVAASAAAVLYEAVRQRS
ncbi:MAG: RNA methyltransferase [Candidatus Eremiobacteraeota bacterium]|nr:RNA methyltransferase [Candidatus Eremiobacteraeota bacterium]